MNMNCETFYPSLSNDSHIQASASSQKDLCNAGTLSIYHDFLSEVGDKAQFQDCTSGLHALNRVYSHYGQKTEKRILGKRMGIDPQDKEAERNKYRACLHPDLIRMLTEDSLYFESLCLDQNLRKSIKSLKRKLHNGGIAMVLIRRRENGNMHWVTAQKAPLEKLMLHDCLSSKTYTVCAYKFIRECVLSCFFIRPKSQQDTLPSDTGFIGSVEFLKAIKRYHEINSTKGKMSPPKRIPDQVRFRFIPKFL